MQQVKVWRDERCLGEVTEQEARSIVRYACESGMYRIVHDSIESAGKVWIVS